MSENWHRPRGNQAIKMLSLIVSAGDADLLERYACYVNDLAAFRKERLQRKATRKSVAEQALADGVEVLRARIAKMLAGVGPLPSAEDTPEAAAERLRYAKKALDWHKKNPA